MKQISLICLFALVLMVFSGCAPQETTTDLVATTLPVYQFTTLLCQGTGLTVTQLVTESVSCLHDYTLNIRQVKAIEGAKLVILSGAGLEDFMAESLAGKQTLDAAMGISLLESCHDHDHGNDEHGHGHEPEMDAHIWLSPANALVMAENICNGLKASFPEHAVMLDANFQVLQSQILALQEYGRQQLSQLRCRDIITLHDGFAYFAEAFDLTILAAVEEESGSEASAQELIALIYLIRDHKLPAIFTEQNGATAAATTLAAETGIAVFTLDMAMSGDWFAAMYHNIDTMKEALG